MTKKIMEFQLLIQMAILISVIITVAHSSVAPRFITYKSKKVEKVTKAQTNAYLKHFEASKYIARHDGYSGHHVKSDAMQLYSISGKGIVRVQDAGNSWDHQYAMSVIKRNGHDRNQNKFVTETVSYGMLKIRSDDNNHYLCARSNGEIVFKENPNTRRNKIRKRCLFNWTFTFQMHIKLSVRTNKKKWYLTVQNDAVVLTRNSKSTELEKSFIWLPAKSAKKDLMESTQKNPKQRVTKHITSQNERGFTIDMPKTNQKTCNNESLNKKLFIQKRKIRMLREELKKLRQQKAPLEQNKSLPIRT